MPRRCGLCYEGTHEFRALLSILVLLSSEAIGGRIGYGLNRRLLESQPRNRQTPGGFFSPVEIERKVTVNVRTDDLRIRDIRELTTPETLMREFAITEQASTTVTTSRSALQRILHGADDRLAVVIGPCSIHDPIAAIEYAKRLKEQRDRHSDTLEIIMRVYFEKPRTTVGWKGLINDPHLDGSFDINQGLRRARGLLLDINQLGLPAGCEFLDIITPQYMADLVS